MSSPRAPEDEAGPADSGTSSPHEPRQKSRPSFSLRQFARRRPIPILATWILACAAIAVLWSSRGPNVSGDLDGLIPIEHRAPREHTLAMLWRAADGGATAGDLLISAEQIHEVLGSRWVPIAAPAAEVSGWLDAHALYLLPVSSHEALASRLSDDAIAREVVSLRSRLSSPFFAIGTADARRDPLRLSQLTDAAAGGLRENAAAGWRTNVSAPGDLITKDSSALLMMVADDRPLRDLEEELAAQVGDGIEVAIVGPALDRHLGRDRVELSLGRLLAIALASMTIILAVAVRQVRQAVGILLCLGTVLAGLALFVPLDPLSLPLLVLLAGFACDAGLPMQRISGRGLPALLIVALALAPLWLTDYPLWQAWSWHWFFAASAAFIGLRLWLPAMLSLLRVQPNDVGRGFLLRPIPRVAIVIAGLAIGAGFWSIGDVRLRGADSFDLGADTSQRGPSLRETFFNPRLVAWVTTTGSDAAEALSRSAVDSRLLGEWIPDEVAFVDSPGRVVLPQAELNRRRVALRELDLPGRLAHLGEALENAGFRPAAFGEFLRNASDPDQAPTVDAALDSPLALWIARYTVETGGAVAIRSEVHLSGNPRAVPPDVETPDGRRLELRGPAVAARTDLRALRDRFGVYVLCQIWLFALLIWLGSRSLPSAIASGFASLMTHSALLSLMVTLDVALSPLLLPVLLLAGAASAIAAARACTAVELQTPLFAMGLVVTSACQVGAAAALMSSNVPSWNEIGYVAAIGAVISVGFGLFVAPGLAAVFRSFGRDRPPAPNPEDPES